MGSWWEQVVAAFGGMVALTERAGVEGSCGMGGWDEGKVVVGMGG